jgi:hypothetical protein
VLLGAPYPLLAYQASSGNIEVYSDHPIPSAINSVPGDAVARLTRISAQLFVMTPGGGSGRGMRMLWAGMGISITLRSWRLSDGAMCRWILCGRGFIRDISLRSSIFSGRLVFRRMRFDKALLAADERR